MIFGYIFGTIFGLILLIVAFFTICALTVDPKKEYNGYNRFFRRVFLIAVSIVKKILRIKVHATGMEKLPEGKFLIVANHRSTYDPVVNFDVFRQHLIGFISKPSNFKIPLLGRMSKQCCFMAIDRENPRNALKTINRAADVISADTACMVVYPEGTRSKTGELLEFHNGVFKIAQKANVPIVVVALQGTEKISKNYIRRTTHVYHDIVDVISAAEVQKMKTDDIGERVRVIIAEKING